MKHYSPSQLTMFLRCSAAWKYRYVDGLKIPPASAMVLGTSYHKGLETNYSQKINSMVDLPIMDVLDATSTELDTLLRDEVSWSEEERSKGLLNVKGELKDKVTGLVKTYQIEKSPYIQPESVEKDFIIEFQNVDYIVKGRVDLVDNRGNIRENKTSGITPSQISADHKLQGTFYAIAERKKNVVFDYAIKTKTPKIVSHEFAPDESEKDFSLKITSLVDSASKSGAYLPNRNHFMCSKSQCGFWRNCLKEFKGSIKE